MEFRNSGEKLLYNVLIKVIPSEALEILKPENIQALAKQVGDKFRAIEDQQREILSVQQEILRRLDERNNGNSGDATAGQFLPSGDASNSGSGGSSDCASGDASGES